MDLERSLFELDGGGLEKDLCRVALTHRRHRDEAILQTHHSEGDPMCGRRAATEGTEVEFDRLGVSALAPQLRDCPKSE
jgi:hypothetical protein